MLSCNQGSLVARLMASGIHPYTLNLGLNNSKEAQGFMTLLFKHRNKKDGLESPLMINPHVCLVQVTKKKSPSFPKDSINHLSVRLIKIFFT